MKLFIGLGNPGKRYENTRHNVGFIVVDRIQDVNKGNEWGNEKKYRAEICNLPLKDIMLVKPQTFMNESGLSVYLITSFYKIKTDDIYVFHDDLDIRLGEYKIQKGIGPELHYGIRSIENSLGSKDFWRVRIGIDNRNPVKRIDGEEYVLQKFNREERKVLDGLIDKLLDEINNLLVK